MYQTQDGFKLVTFPWNSPQVDLLAGIVTKENPVVGTALLLFV